MSEKPVRSTDMVKASRQELAPPAEISKFDIGAITMWFGTRDLVEDDLATFNFELNFRSFPLYSTFAIPDAAKVKGGAYPAFFPIDRDIEHELGMLKERPIAIFIIGTQELSEYSWFNQLPRGIMEFRSNQGRANSTFVYRVFLDWGFSQEGPDDPQGRFSKRETRAHQLDGVFIPYSHDYRSLGIRRTIEFMSRVMGCDLPGEKFPNYTTDEVQKIAWNINREDFNAFSPREGAIPKYPIINGEPQFPF